MRSKKLFLIPAILSLVSCAVPTVMGIERASFTVTRACSRYGTSQLTFRHSFFGDGVFSRGFENVSMPKTPLVAGDYFEVEYYGLLTALTSSPCQFVLEGGDVVGTRFVPTSVHKTTLDFLNKETNLDFFSTAVILNSHGDWECILDYQGDELYYTLDMGYYEENRCPEDAVCEELPIVIAGVYAYNPRI